MQCTSRTFTLDLTEEALKILPLVETFFSTNTSPEFIPRDFIKNTLHHMDYLAWVQNIVRQLPSCINEKYNGFPVISIEYSKKLRKKFKAINIIYKPVKSPEKKFSVTTPKIFDTEILAETAKNYRMGLPLSVIVVESFL